MMDNKSLLFEMIKDGDKKEFEFKGLKFYCGTPSVKQVFELQGVLSKYDNMAEAIRENFNVLSKIIIDNIYEDEDTKLFNKKDVGFLENDRSGFFLRALNELADMIDVFSEETLEDNKKK